MPDANCQKPKRVRTEIILRSFIVFVLATSVALSQHAIQHLSTPLLTDHYVKFAPNKLTIWFSNNGDQSYDWMTGAAGWEYPSGSGKYVGFESGLIWGGLVNGEIRVGGSTYRHGLHGGKILPNGNPTDSANAIAKIYAIKQGDEQTGTNWDYNNWPHWEGAPVDQNLKPSMCGDEQLWFVSNDLNPYRTIRLYGSQPIGLEIQTTVWAYNSDPLLKEAVFVRHLMINKGVNDLSEAYVGVWCDYDLGDPSDDCVGVDTTLKLGYVYNGVERDPVFGIPPAAGVVLIHTPIVVSPSDSVVFKGRMRLGYMSSAIAGHQFFMNASSVYRDVDIGSNDTNRTLQIHFHHVLTRFSLLIN